MKHESETEAFLRHTKRIVTLETGKYIHSKAAEWQITYRDALTRICNTHEEYDKTICQLIKDKKQLAERLAKACQK